MFFVYKIFHSILRLPNYMNETNDLRLYYLALRNIPGVGLRTASLLISEFGSVKEIFDKDVSEIKTVGKIKNQNFEKQFNRRILFQRAEKELDTLIKKGYGVITYEDFYYPSNLKNIPDPPVLLYYKGNIEDDINTIAVVGTRRPTPDGEELAYNISYDLSSYDVVIVSGLAKGIDSNAHRGCVDNKKRTIAVLGSGIDVIYPRDNKKLYQNIVENDGLIITEYPLGAKPERYHFPQRNRIIAGISLGVVVVQSPEDSGSLITAKLGNDYGRTIFAFPGKPGSKMYKGSNNLLKQGAVLIESAEDVLEQLKYELSVERKNINNIIKEREEKMNISKNFEIEQKTSPTSKKILIDNDEPKLIMNDLTEEEKKVFRYLNPNEKKHIDQLCIESQLDISSTTRILTSLIIKGVIEEYNGNFYTLKID